MQIYGISAFICVLELLLRQTSYGYPLRCGNHSALITALTRSVLLWRTPLPHGFRSCKLSYWIATVLEMGIAPSCRSQCTNSFQNLIMNAKSRNRECKKLSRRRKRFAKKKLEHSRILSAFRSEINQWNTLLSYQPWKDLLHQQKKLTCVSIEDGGNRNCAQKPQNLSQSHLSSLKNPNHLPTFQCQRMIMIL